MEKSEAKHIIKSCLSPLGFQSRGNFYYKLISPDYAVGVWLDKNPYQNSYFVEYGVLFFPEKSNKPFAAGCDWRSDFFFTKEPADDLTRHLLTHHAPYKNPALTQHLFYNEKTPEALAKEVNFNIQQRLLPVYNKEYVLQLYRDNWIYFRMISYESGQKICALAELDWEDVKKFRDDLPK